MVEKTEPKRLLTIAGSDSGGGAGIQADLKTFIAHSHYGMSVVTSLTAQNTLGVQGIHAIPPAFIAQQLESIVDDIGVDAIKIGMLGEKGVVDCLVESISRHWKEDKPKIVLDPVCVSTSGHELLKRDAIQSLRANLIPLTTIITPNIPEAMLLASEDGAAFPSEQSIESVEAMRACARKLTRLGSRWVLLKGGHLPMTSTSTSTSYPSRIRSENIQVVTDLLIESETGKEWLFERPFIDSRNTHGTGCTLSSALACQLAEGRSVPEAVQMAGDYVAGAIAASYPLGNGSGPVNHSFNLIQRSLPLPTKYNPSPFTDYLKAYDKDAWHRYVHHPFPKALASGRIPSHSFIHFIEQDYHFLKHYARTNSLIAYKTESLPEMEASTVIVQAVIKETEMHVAFCESFGVSRKELETYVPHPFQTRSYNRYVLDTCNKGDLLDCRVVTAPCLIGYGEVGQRLAHNPTPEEAAERDSSESNRYWKWIQEYGQDWYQEAVETGVDLLEKTVADSPISASRLEEVAKIFRRATLLEVAFWDAAMAASERRTGSEDSGTLSTGSAESPGGKSTAPIAKRGRELSLPSPSNPCPFTDYLRNYDKDAWQRYVHHPFAQGLACGTLPAHSFLHFIKQGYHYLKHYARANSLMSYKSESLAEMEASTVIVMATIKETAVNIALCEKYGISRQALEQCQESLTTIGYSRFLLDTCSKGDLLDCRIATTPCLIGYGEVGKRLSTQPGDTENNTCRNWVSEYGKEWYQTSVQTCIDALEKAATESPISPLRLEELAKVFRQATLLEIAFWDDAMKAVDE